MARIVSVTPSAFSVLTRIIELLRREASLHGASDVSTRPDLLAIDLALGLPDEEIARRYGLDADFLARFREENRAAIEDIAYNAYGIHALLRLLLSMKASMFLDRIVWGDVSDEDAIRVQAAKALVVPIPQIILDTPKDLVDMLREYLTARAQDVRDAPSAGELGEPPRVRSLEEVIEERGVQSSG